MATTARCPHRKYVHTPLPSGQIRSFDDTPGIAVLGWTDIPLCGPGHRGKDVQAKLMPAGVELTAELIDAVADERDHPHLRFSSSREGEERYGAFVVHTAPRLTEKRSAVSSCASKSVNRGDGVATEADGAK